MPVTVAKTAGFCFGVQRAVDTVYQQLKESQLTGFPKLYTLGEIIHNPQVVEELRSLGAVAVDSLEQLLTLEAQANPPVPVIIRCAAVGLHRARAKQHPLHRRHLPLCQADSGAGAKSARRLAGADRRRCSAPGGAGNYWPLQCNICYI